MSDHELFQRLLDAVGKARGAARDVLAAKRVCNCELCHEITGISYTLGLFEDALACRSPPSAEQTEEAAEALEAA